MRGLTQEDKNDIIESWQNLVRMADIAKQYGLTRQRIWQVLNAAGADTSKGEIIVICDECGKEFGRHKCYVRKSKRRFCSNDCYYAWLSENSIDKGTWRHGMRIARATVSQHYRLRQGNVVHHKDGDNHNNALQNLMVFECNGDHVRYHRGFNVKPLFDGALQNR